MDPLDILLLPDSTELMDFLQGRAMITTARTPTYFGAMRFALLIAMLLLLSGAAFAAAEGKKQQFQLRDAEGNDRGVYSTQAEAEAAIKAIPGPQNMEDAYQYVDTIKDTVVKENGSSVITYWMGRTKAIDEEWMYTTWHTSKIPTEEQAAIILAQEVSATKPACPPASVSPVEAWRAISGPYPEYDIGIEGQSRGYSAHTYYEDCSGPDEYITYMSRTRRSECPKPYASWHISDQGCTNKEIFATIEVSTLQCETQKNGGNSGMRGNPCDVKTGEKFQTERDLDLGWITLTRYYHSGIALNTGGFGPGWTFSHSLHLTIQGDTLGLVEGSGYAVPFRKMGSEYRAANASDERIVANSDQWILYRQDAIYTFDAKGKLVSRMAEDGSGWVYGYNARGRLQSIASLQGRSLELVYADENDDALISGVVSGGVQLVSYSYDQQRLTGVTYADGKSRIYHYEDTRFPRHLTGVTTEDGQRFSTFAYDEVGRAISSQHAGGIDGITLAYSAAGTRVTDALGDVNDYTMTDAGGVSPKVAAVARTDGTLQYSYNDQSSDFRRRLSSVTDRRGVQTQHSYAEATENGVVVNIHTVREAVGQPQERTTTTRTAAGSNRLLSVQTGGRTVSYSYNDRLQPVQMTSSDTASGKQRTVTYSYCEAADVAATDSTCPILGLPKSVDGARADVNDTTTFTYYPADDTTCATSPTSCAHRKGDLWKVTHALGQITEYLAYDGAGRVLSAKNANGVVTDYTYHPRGWLTASKVRGSDDSSESDDRITAIDYWPTGLVKQVTQPDGAFTRFTYDAAHRLTDIADNAGNTIHYTLDNAGNRSKEDTKDASGTLKRTLSRVYNQLGQLVTQATAQGDPTDFGYDPNGNTKTVTDALGHVTQNDYDPLNRLARTLQDVGGIAAETKFGYDALDNLTKVTDPKGLDTTYAYNGLGDLTKLTSPDTGSTTYTYDSAGNRATQTDARNIKTSYGYDALNRLTQVGYPTTSLNVSYTYDVSQSTCASGETYGVGHLTRMQDGSGSTDYCYDRFGGLVRKVQTTNGKVFVVRYAYTKAGQLSRLTYPDGAVVDYVRNAQGQTTEVGVTPPGGTRQVLLNQATYYPFGPVAGWTYGNGRPMQRVLDQDYRPLAVNDTRSDGLAVGFAFDPVGNLSALTAPGNTAPVIKLDYDPLGRLTAFKDGPTDTVIDGYTYDATGNRLSAKVNTSTQTYSYPTTSHRLSSVAGTARSYDAAGNTTAIGGTAVQYVYGANGRLTQVKRSSTTVANYAYNGRGEQVRRVGKTNTYTLYDESGHWLGDYDNNGAVVQQAIWLDDLPVGVLAKNTLRYVQPDHLGTPRAVIDPVRDVAIWRWDLKGEAFGATAPDQDPDKDGTAFVFDMRFPGQRYDALSGLNQNYFRDYEPGTGRYVQSDPIGLGGGMSTYAYVGLNPAYSKDLYGLESPGWWSFPPGVQRERWRESQKHGYRGELNFQLSLGGSYGNFAAGGSGEGGIALDTSGKICLYMKGCGTTPVAGGFIGGLGGTAGFSCGTGGLSEGKSSSVQLQIGAMEGAGAKGSVEVSKDGSASLGINAGIGSQVSGGFQQCQTRTFLCTK
ncbi:RHS repeat-associated protein [Xanthomonas sacchari]|uniref:RHS repeat-associated core domain-containing protein n=1 Tax=unclassified Xanthomonas TaxID=2643310 RepID=UPI0017D18DCD|nr:MULTISPECIES: RHS repeat-associated core domain-containing protein [unclassified Xanthomonas]MBB6367942.1 RHS repeat-associated protein [Xanthomonas sp. F10]